MTEPKRFRKHTRIQSRTWFVIRGDSPATGATLSYDGRQFVASGKAKFYGTMPQARARVRWLLEKFPLSKRMNVRVEKAPKAYKNPSSYERARQLVTDQLDRAADTYAEFMGRPATHVTRHQVNDGKKGTSGGFALGKLVGVIYRANREGDPAGTVYHHEFKKSSQPLLIVKDDGASLGIVGGRFQVTERGIEDR